MLEMILAVDKNGCIGKSGDLPWRIPKDLQHFKSKTINKIVVMGYSTWVSLEKKDLPNRKNLIISRKKSGNKFINDLKDVIELSKEHEVVVIGGAEIYNQLAAHADKIHVTHVDTIVDKGDTFFDMTLLNLFTKASSTKMSDNGYDLEFATYTPKPKKGS